MPTLEGFWWNQRTSVGRRKRGDLLPVRGATWVCSRRFPPRVCFGQGGASRLRPLPGAVLPEAFGSVLDVLEA